MNLEYLTIEELHAKKGLKVDIGNSKKKEGWITLDVNGNPTKKYDLSKCNLPFKKNSIDYFLIKNALEHASCNPGIFFKDLYDKMKPGAEGIIVFGNPAHWANRLRFLFGSSEMNTDWVIWQKMFLKPSYIINTVKSLGFITYCPMQFYQTIAPDFFLKRVEIRVQKPVWDKKQ